ncbi:hypothetical protein [Streptomyces violens]|uniref:hypothetical protein n=1 Tax=Streptomyces violens TaxID=66377 RepID=UPI0004C1CFD6|nr:hypothetical protein [Streptomyces violens]
MRRTTVGASAGALLLLGALLAFCGSSEGPGYIATGTADDRSPHKLVAPTDDVTLAPLDGPDTDTGPDTDAGTGAPVGSPGERPDGTADGTTPPAGTPAPSGRPQPPSGNTPDAPADSDAPADPAGPNTEAPSPTPTPPDERPALLEVGTPTLANADVRWCERVTVQLHNTGSRPVTAGTITFKTHIIGGLGIDWGTRESTRELPVPIAGGETKKETWKVCVDAWRVPLGMHIDTRDIDASWD